MMDPNMTSRTFNNRIDSEKSSLPSWRGLGIMLTLIITLAFATTVAFAQPNTDPFAVPLNAPAELDRAREADADRWAAQGEYLSLIHI